MAIEMNDGCPLCGQPFADEGGHLAVHCPTQPERIIRAAIMLPGGTVLSLPVPARHCDIIRAYRHDGDEAVSNQGFRTSKGRYVSREEALAIAIAAGQIKEKTGNPNKLFSEDLW